MRRFLLLAGLIVLPSWLLTMPCDAQSKIQSVPMSTPPLPGNEQGLFKILFGGEVIGQERYQIVRDGDSFKASGETHLTVDRGSEKVTFSIRPLLQFSKAFEPLVYQILQESGGNKMKARVNFKPGMSQAIYETGKEADTREIELRKDVLILDDNVFHHYVILARRFDYSKGGTQQFSAFVPQQFMAGGITVEDEGFEQVSLGDKKVSLQHLLVDTGDLQVSLWINERHELQKISVPKSNVDVIRE
jgi:hypothetical protein